MTDPTDPRTPVEQPLQGLASYLRCIASTKLIYGSDAHQTHTKWAAEIDALTATTEYLKQPQGEPVPDTNGMVGFQEWWDSVADNCEYEVTDYKKMRTAWLAAEKQLTQPQASEPKPINVGTIAHIGNGRTTLTAAIAAVIAKQAREPANCGTGHCSCIECVMGVNKPSEYSEMAPQCMSTETGIQVNKPSVEGLQQELHIANTRIRALQGLAVQVEDLNKLLKNLCFALNNVYISYRQSTHGWQKELDAANEYLKDK